MSKKIIMSAIALLALSPLAIFAAENPTNSAPYTQFHQWHNNSNATGSDPYNWRNGNWNNGGHNNGGTGNDNHNWDWNNRHWQNNDWNRYFNWNRNNWRNFGWNTYNWRGYGNTRNALTGTVVDINPDSILVMGRNGGTYLINISNANITSGSGMPLPIRRVRPGDQVVVSGLLRGNTGYASSLTDLSL